MAVEPIRNCRNCGQEIPLGKLACEKCHTLVYSEELERIAARGRILESEGRLAEARHEWLQALAYLPAESTQAQWVRSQAQKLELASRNASPAGKHAWVEKLGPLAPIAIVLAKSKSLVAAIFKMKFLLSLGAFLALYWALYGVKFGAGFALLILIHEMGHYIDIRRRGLPADMPVFLPGLGAYVRWQALGVTRQTRAAVSLAGPCAGLLGAVVCALLWCRTRNGLWAALASSSAWLNILNLIPVWVLDGGQAAVALSKIERVSLLSTGLLLWLFLGNGLFFLVAAGAAYRLFTKDFSPIASPRITTYFVTLLAALGAVVYLMPSGSVTR